jgi:hypothetical protein
MTGSTPSEYMRGKQTWNESSAGIKKMNYSHRF